MDVPQAAKTRYVGKPFLKLLDAYVLARIGRLQDDDRARLEAMTPKFQQTFHRVGTWEEIVEAEMEWDAELPRAIQSSWHRWRAANGDDAVAFAWAFVDEAVRER